jgi:hypothetical protein
VSFQYTFQVSGKKGARSGRGETQLRLAPARGGFTVAAENGKVLARD